MKRWAARPCQLTDAPFSTRRRVYGFIERQNLPAFFRTFDFANPNTHTPERPQTVSPQQALFLLNSPFVIEQATHLAAQERRRDRLQRPVMLIVSIALIAMFRYAVGRDANDEELADALEFVGTERMTISGFERRSAAGNSWPRCC